MMNITHQQTQHSHDFALFYAIDSARSANQGNISELCAITSEARSAIHQGANLNAIHPISGLTPLAMAIRNQSVDLVHLLLENNCDPNFGGANVHPIVLAANCLPIVVHELIQRGADLTLNFDGTIVGDAVINALSTKGLHNESNQIKALTHMNNHISEMIAEHKFSSQDGKLHKLFDIEKLQKEISTEKNESRAHYLKRLLESTPIRCYRRPKSSIDSADILDDLYERFPNFAETLDVLSEQTALANLSPNAVFSIRPILLVGPPGVGKTRFMREVAKVLDFEFININCGGITAGWILSGSSVSWSDGRPGMVHSALRDGSSANPIMLLDEIDKLSGDQRFSGFGPLYQLLDRESSVNFADEAVGIPVDCSYVSWVATANDTNSIPEAILSRFTIIEVDSPTKDQMANVIQSIYSDILNENKASWGSHFSPEINEDILDSLEGQPPREIVKMILTAMGRAARARREEVYTLESGDFKDFKKKARRIGF